MVMNKYKDLKRVLSMYLPYEIKVKAEFNLESELIIPWYYETDDDNPYLTLEGMMLDWLHDGDITNIIPILRPISDLNKPLKDGTIPIIELANKYSGNKYELNDKGECVCWYDYYNNYEFKYEDASFYYYWTSHREGSIGGTSTVRFNADINIETYMYLFKNHFDVFDWIKKNKAIDINETVLSKLD